MKDVIVIGGGPAGAATASYVARHGHSVLVLEKEKFPREHVGGSLLPFCYPILAELGVLEEMEHLFVRKPTVRFLSSDGSKATNWCFSQVIHDESHLSFQVDRGYFDMLLLRNAARLGAEVREETRVTDVDFDTDPEAVRVTSVGPDGAATTHQARFLIDASGRNSFLSTRNRWRHPNPGLERTALWTVWKGVTNYKSGLENGATLIVYLGGDKRGWIWLFPVAKDTLSIGVVLDSFYLREKKRAVQNGETDWQTQVYIDELFESSFVKDVLAGAERGPSLFVEGDYSYYSDQKYGDRFAMVGDSGQFIDPIFSSGVYLSLKTGAMVGNRLHEMLAENDVDHTRLADIYETVNGAYALVKELIELYYDPKAISFADLGHAVDVEESEDAYALGHFFLAGDFFENNTRYRSFFDLLVNPRYFDIYKETVINKFPTLGSSCEIEPGTQIFPDDSYRQEYFDALKKSS